MSRVREEKKSCKGGGEGGLMFSTKEIGQCGTGVGTVFINLAFFDVWGQRYRKEGHTGRLSESPTHHARRAWDKTVASRETIPPAGLPMQCRVEVS